MGSCRTKFLAIFTAVFGLTAAAPLVYAHPLTSEFTRIPLGYTVSAWYPIDINNDSLWELAITCGGTPTRIGIFSPETKEWIDGPHPVTAVGSSWGVGDYTGNGTWDYAYRQYDSIRLHRFGASSDSLLWVAPFHVASAAFWGADSGGRSLIGLSEGRHFYSEVWVDDFIHVIDSSSWIIHVCDLMDGTELFQFFGGPGPWRVVSGFPPVAGDRLAVHQHQMTVDQFFFTRATYVDTILLADSRWNGNRVLRLGIQWGSAGYPPDPAYLTHTAAIPGGSPAAPRVLIDMLTQRLTRPCGIYYLDVGRDSVVWFQSFPAPYYLNFAACDLNSDGQPALYLPLISGAGWEVRSLANGAIVDTLPGMPKADLQTGPLTVAGQQDLFYIADSGLYIWGLPTSVNDDQTHATSLPTTPWLIAHPNPFNGNVHLDWSPGTAATALDIFNILGQRIRSYDLSAGDGSRTSVEWDGRNDGGRSVPSGMYFARLSCSGRQVVTKLVLLK